MPRHIQQMLEETYHPPLYMLDDDAELDALIEEYLGEVTPY